MVRAVVEGGVRVAVWGVGCACVGEVWEGWVVLLYVPLSCPHSVHYSRSRRHHLLDQVLE